MSFIKYELNCISILLLLVAIKDYFQRTLSKKTDQFLHPVPKMIEQPLILNIENEMQSLHTAILSQIVASFTLTNHLEDKVVKKFLVDKIAANVPNFSKNKISRDLRSQIISQFGENFQELGITYRRQNKRYYIGLKYTELFQQSEVRSKKEKINRLKIMQYHYNRIMKKANKKEGGSAIDHLLRKKKSTVVKPNIARRTERNTDLDQRIKVEEEMPDSEQSYVEDPFFDQYQSENVNISRKNKQNDKKDENGKEKLQLRIKILEEQLQQAKRQNSEALKNYKAAFEIEKGLKQSSLVEMGSLLKKHSLLENEKNNLIKALKQFQGQYNQLRFDLFREQQSAKQKEERLKKDFIILQRKICFSYPDQYNRFQELSLSFFGQLLKYCNLAQKIESVDLSQLLKDFFKNSQVLTKKLLIDPRKGNLRKMLGGLQYVRNIRSHEVDSVDQWLLKFGYDNLLYIYFDLQISTKIELKQRVQSIMKQILLKRKYMYELCWQIFEP